MIDYKSHSYYVTLFVQLLQNIWFSQTVSKNSILYFKKIVHDIYKISFTLL